MEFAKDGTAALRQKILSVLDELLFRNVITKEEHKDIKEDSKVDQTNWSLLKEAEQKMEQIIPVMKEHLLNIINA